MSKQHALEQMFEGQPEILGARVRDKVTGFTGIATGYHQYLTGCARVSVSPGLGSDGKPIEVAVFDEPMLEILEPAKKKKPKAETSSPRGGPMKSITKISVF